MSWEIDAECIAVLDEHFAPMHMGDITTFNIETFVESIMDNVDQDKPIMVVAAGGPPCPDFSSIKQQPKGSAGATGHLFQHTVDVLTSIKKALHPVPVHVLPGERCAAPRRQSRYFPYIHPVRHRACHC